MSTETDLSSSVERDDWTLLQQAAAGDNVAFQCVYDRHANALLRFLASRVAWQDAEELHAELWLKVLKHPPQQSIHCRGWLFQVAKNLMKDLFRRQRRRGETTSENPFENVAGEIDRSPELESRENDFRQCIDHLDADFAAVVRGFLQGNSHETIATQLNIKVGTSHSRLARAKDMLKGCLERKGWQA